MEASRAAAHFKYDPDATYVILTPPRPIASGQPVYCGYHTQTTSINALGAVTDPDNFFSVQDGWNDDQTSENADKCAWIETQNISLAGTISQCNRRGATRPSTPARTAAPSPASSGFGSARETRLPAGLAS